MLSRFDLWSRYVASTTQPILVGPWRSELGFECLYWLPWLAAWRAKYKIAKDRLIAISRGGAGVWYDAAQAVELYDYAPLAKVRQALLRDQAKTASVKQNAITEWEQRLLPVLAHDLGLRRYHVLHPSVMYQALASWFDGQMGSREIGRALRYEPLPVPSPPLTLALPERFVAVGFYARHTWPLSEELKTWAADLVDGMAKRCPVVLIDNGLYADDHIPFPFAGQNVLSLKDYVTPQNNLAVQSAVLAKATAFVGTYGGTMQLAVRLRKPAMGFYQKFEGTCYAHKQLTEWLGVQQGVPTFIGRPDDARFVFEVMGV